MKKSEKQIDNIIGKYRQIRREDLIPLLQEIQEETGYLPMEAIVRIGKLAGLSTTKIYGLATFYDQFRFSRRGKVHLVICNGTSCYINGAGAVTNKIREILGIEPGETTRDGIFSYELSNCMGGCLYGPVLIVNGEYHLRIKADQIPDLINMLRINSESF